MKSSELAQIGAALVVMTLVAGFPLMQTSGLQGFLEALLFSAIILVFAVLGKKIMAFMLDADVEHELWKFRRYGFKSHYYLPKPIPIGIILPLFFTVFSLGVIKFLAVLTYETTALKHRAARRFGFYSYTEMTDWHNALIGAGGIVAVLVVSFVSYFPGLEYLSKIAAFYAFSNMLPISKLDGAQIFFGSRPLYAALAVSTLIFFIYGLVL